MTFDIDHDSARPNRAYEQNVRNNLNIESYLAILPHLDSVVAVAPYLILMI